MARRARLLSRLVGMYLFNVESGRAFGDESRPLTNFLKRKSIDTFNQRYQLRRQCLLE